ncbi:MAG: hypothetical protein WDN76_13395 [Alphaproteobacteria bacterium]
MAEYQFLGAEIEKNRADARVEHKKRYKSLLGLAFALAGCASMLAGLPDLVSYLLWPAASPPGCT